MFEWFKRAPQQPPSPYLYTVERLAPGGERCLAEASGDVPLDNLLRALGIPPGTGKQVACYNSVFRIRRVDGPDRGSR